MTSVHATILKSNPTKPNPNPNPTQAGSLSTEHHRVSVRVKSLLDAVDDGGAAAAAAGMGPAVGDDDLNDHPAAREGATRAPAAPAGGAVKGDEGDEGGAGVQWSDRGAVAGLVLHGRRVAGGGDNGDDDDAQMMEGGDEGAGAKPPAGQGIRREEALPAGGGGQLDPSTAGLGPSQEVDGPPGGE